MLLSYQERNVFKSFKLFKSFKTLLKSSDFLNGLNVLNLLNEHDFDHRFFVRASLRMLSALLMLKTPQLQKRAIVRAAAAALRRFSLTQSIIFLAKLAETVPCPHIVVSSRTVASGKRSTRPQKPREYSTL